MSTPRGPRRDPPRGPRLPVINRSRAGKKPYSRGWKSGWKGEWGPIADGHSKLGKLARRIERELIAVHDDSTELYRRKIKTAAKFMALAEQTIASIGIEPKATRRQATSASLQAEKLLATVPKRSKAGAPSSGAELIASQPRVAAAMTQNQDSVPPREVQW